MSAKGFFIVFEGGEGSGKSTQIRHLQKYFVQKYGMDWVVVTREPGGGIANHRQKIFNIKKNNQSISPSELAQKELDFFEEDRAMHVQNLIRPKVEAGRIVLCDRFAPSTIAYQGYARGMDLEIIRHANEKATGGLVPDLIILMDIDPEIAVARKFQHQIDELNHFDKEKLSFHKKVRQGFLAQAQAEPDCWVIIDASQNEELITYQLIKTLNKQLGL